MTKPTPPRLTVQRSPAPVTVTWNPKPREVSYVLKRLIECPHCAGQRYVVVDLHAAPRPAVDMCNPCRKWLALPWWRRMLARLRGAKP